MIILGINDTHDASACLIKDGKLLIAIEEERFRRVILWLAFRRAPRIRCLKILFLNDLQGVTQPDADQHQRETDGDAGCGDERAEHTEGHNERED